MNKRFRYTVVFMIVSLFLFNFIGCGDKDSKEGEKNKQESSFEITTAINVVNNYMKFLINEDYDDAMKFYTKDFLDKTKKLTSNEFKIRGYNVEETNEIGKSAVIKLKVTRAHTEKSISSLEDYFIKVIKDGAEYKISEIKYISDKEAFNEEMGIRQRSKNNVKTDLVMDFSGIPKYFFQKDDAASTYKMSVPRKQFGVTQYSYKGDKLAISTLDKNTFIGVVYIDESLAVQGAGDSNANDQGSAVQQQGGATKSIIREKPIGKELVSFDLLENSKVEYMIFSLDEKFLLVQYNKGTSKKCIRVYKVEDGEAIPFNFEKEYPLDKVEVKFSSYDRDVLNYEVKAKKSIDSSESDLIGKWQMDLKEFKVKKI